MADPYTFDPAADYAPGGSIPMTRTRRRSRLALYPHQIPGDNGDGAQLLPAPPRLTDTLNYQQEQHQRMLANMGVVNRGPSPEFAASHPAAANLPQFDPTGGVHDRTVENLEAAAPVYNYGGAHAGVHAPGVAGTAATRAAVPKADYSTAFKNFLGTAERPGLDKQDALAKAQATTQPSGIPVDPNAAAAAAATTQPTSTPQPVAPAPNLPRPMIGTAGRPGLEDGEANPATGLTRADAHANNQAFVPHPVAFSEQQARQVFHRMAQDNPNAHFEAIEPGFIDMMKQHGVDGRAMLDQWRTDGSYGKFDYAQPGQSTPAQPKATMSLAEGQKLLGTGQVDTGAAGNRPLLATLPSGETVMVDQHGQRVGPTISRGAPMQPKPVMGPEPGYTPAPGIDPRSTRDPQSPHLAKAIANVATAPAFIYQAPQTGVGAPSSGGGGLPFVDPETQMVAGSFGGSPAPAAAPAQGRASLPPTSDRKYWNTPGVDQSKEPAAKGKKAGLVTRPASPGGLKPLPESLVMKTHAQFAGDRNKAKKYLTDQGYDINNVVQGQ